MLSNVNFKSFFLCSKGFSFYIPKVSHHFKSSGEAVLSALAIGMKKIAIESDWGQKSYSFEKLAVIVTGSTQPFSESTQFLIGLTHKPFGSTQYQMAEN